MGLSNTQYRDIMYKYDQLRLKNKRLVASRYEKLYEKIPELRNIQNEIINLSTNQARMELLNPDEKLDEKAYRAKKDELINKKTELLLANGYPADFLSPIYSCKDCKDTGYIDNKPCHCLKQYEITSLYQNSNLADILEKENFDTFNPAFYDNKHIVENLSLTARENILRVKAVCLDFVKHFDTAYDNLIFYGETGVGKTFLTHCIAKELLDTSHTVVYLTSLQLFDILEKPFQLELSILRFFQFSLLPQSLIMYEHILIENHWILYGLTLSYTLHFEAYVQYPCKDFGYMYLCCM